MSEVFSIGYQGFKSIDMFVNVLMQFGIQVLIDVRSVPYSKYYSSWNKESLSEYLNSKGIYYLNWKNGLGARQTDPAVLTDGRVDFEKFSKQKRFIESIDKIDKSKAVICLMCMEKLPSECHRSILIGRAIKERGGKVNHIIEFGKYVRSQEDIERRLVRSYFGKVEITDELISESYIRRNQEIGYKK